jgi:hypothetical protein
MQFWEDFPSVTRRRIFPASPFPDNPASGLSDCANPAIPRCFAGESGLSDESRHGFLRPGNPSYQLPGQRLEKNWKVRNSGQCDWGPEYRFQWTGGTQLAAQDEFALYPAAAGSEAAIVIPMIAPTAPGEYISDWRAFSPLGVAFGDSLYIDIIVAP